MAILILAKWKFVSDPRNISLQVDVLGDTTRNHILHSQRRPTRNLSPNSNFNPFFPLWTIKTAKSVIDHLRHWLIAISFGRAVSTTLQYIIRGYSCQLATVSIGLFSGQELIRFASAVWASDQRQRITRYQNAFQEGFLWIQCHRVIRDPRVCLQCKCWGCGHCDHCPRLWILTVN